MTPEEKAVVDAALERFEYVFLADEVEPAEFHLWAAVSALRAQREEWIGAGAVSCVACKGAGCEQCSNVGMWREPDKPIIVKVEESYRAEVLKQEWLPATFALCLAGDRIRLSGQETMVRKHQLAEWHARNREWTDDAGKTRDHQTRWDHTELLMDLEANPGMHEYPAATECEILCDAERRAALELQRAFPGTKPVDK